MEVAVTSMRWSLVFAKEEQLMNVRKRALAFVMCILMIMTLLPFSAFAADTGDVVYGRYDENGNWVQGDYADGVWKEGNIVTKKEATSLGNDE